MSIADNLRIIRNKQNISQQEIANFLGIERRTYASWESGEADIKSSYIPKLAGFFHVEINDLFRKKTGNIVINQHNSDNKDTSINNSIVLLVTDKEAVEQLMEVIKKRVENCCL